MGMMSELDDPTPATARDVTSMVEILEGKHGQHAAGVAEFFSSVHQVKGDAGRSWAWAGVAALVRQREQQRMTQR